MCRYDSAAKVTGDESGSGAGSGSEDKTEATKAKKRKKESSRSTAPAAKRPKKEVIKNIRMVGNFELVKSFGTVL